MAVPKFYEFFGSFLRAVDDGKVHKSKDVQKSIAADMNLSEEDMAEQLPSQRQATYVNRIMWARTYLDKAGLISTPTRGHYQITDEGLKALRSGVTIDLNYLDRYESFRQFHTVNPTGTKQIVSAEQQDDEEKTPTEIMNAAFNKMNASLAGELMDMVMGLEPTEFETLVVKLLLKMGYGYGIEDAGKVTRATGDGGIDGIIKEDQLGFNNIYIQAKKWSADHKVSRPEVQKFAGALQGEKATKGLFITTTEFTKDAQDFAANLLGSNIVLIDGNQLTKLMIKYNLGVAVEQTFEVKRIDSDFFSEDL